MFENELYFKLLLADGETNFLRMWWSDNLPCNEENPGCIGITVFDEYMKELDGGELDYEDDTVDLMDMVDECIDFMELNIEEISDVNETTVWKIRKKV